MCVCLRVTGTEMASIAGASTASVVVMKGNNYAGIKRKASVIEQEKEQEKEDDTDNEHCQHSELYDPSTDGESKSQSTASLSSFNSLTPGAQSQLSQLSQEKGDESSAASFKRAKLTPADVSTYKECVNPETGYPMVRPTMRQYDQLVREGNHRSVQLKYVGGPNPLEAKAMREAWIVAASLDRDAKADGSGMKSIEQEIGALVMAYDKMMASTQGPWVGRRVLLQTFHDDEKIVSQVLSQRFCKGCSRVILDRNKAIECSDPSFETSSARPHPRPNNEAACAIEAPCAVDNCMSGCT